MVHPYTPYSYNVEVTRTEIHTVTRLDLDREKVFQRGKQDRKMGKPCASANGAYLDGWYNPNKDFYFITKEAAHLLN